MLDLRSSCLLTTDPATAHIAASNTKPAHTNGTNQPSAGATTPRSAVWPPRDNAIGAATASTISCPTARAVCPSTFPASNARTGAVTTRISTMRVCFSVTVLCAMATPLMPIRKNTSATP